MNPKFAPLPNGNYLNLNKVTLFGKAAKMGCKYNVNFILDDGSSVSCDFGDEQAFYDWIENYVK